jgi:hypothetical protein
MSLGCDKVALVEHFLGVGLVCEAWSLRLDIGDGETEITDMEKNTS